MRVQFKTANFQVEKLKAVFYEAMSKSFVFLQDGPLFTSVTPTIQDQASLISLLTSPVDSEIGPCQIVWEISSSA